LASLSKWRGELRAEAKDGAELQNPEEFDATKAQ